MHLIFHYPPDVFPVLVMTSSFVHVVWNFESRVAAVINLGSLDMWAKRFLIPICKASLFVFLFACFSNKHGDKVPKKHNYF